MTIGYALKTGPLPWLLTVAASAFVATISIEEPSRLPGICGSLGPSALAGIVTLLVHTWSPTAMISAWLLMLATMMPPLLARPVGHVWVCSLRERRARALGLFGLGYTVVWLAAGIVLVPAAVILRVFASETHAGLASLGLAFVWSCSPAAQIARNRCHRVRRISAFGAVADRDCFLQGLTSGVPCLAACWPWMLAPMAMGQLHLAAMATMMFLVFVERLAPPRSPLWQLPPSLTMLTALVRRQKVAGS